MSNYVGVLGGGSFGITCASLLAENSDVLMYVRKEAQVTEINTKHTLKGKTLPPNVIATNDISRLGKECLLIVPVVPSSVFRAALAQLADHLTPKHFIIHATKGLECKKLTEGDDDVKIDRKDIFTMSQLILQETNVLRIGCLAGPNLAREIMSGQPAATVIASDFDEVIEMGRKAFESQRFKVFGSYNLLGTELAGAFKNVIAIASGVLGGLDLGKNMQAVSITRGLHEMIRIGTFLGANRNAFLGVAGVGDLVATATSTDSRNYFLGTEIAKGKSLEQIREEMDEVAEGVYTVKIVNSIVTQNKIHAPICKIIYMMLYQGFPVDKAIPSLMKYPFTHDVDFD